MDLRDCRAKYRALASTLTERTRRVWAATEARAVGPARGRGEDAALPRDLTSGSALKGEEKRTIMPRERANGGRLPPRPRTFRARGPLTPANGARRLHSDCETPALHENASQTLQRLTFDKQSQLSSPCLEDTP